MLTITLFVIASILLVLAAFEQVKYTRHNAQREAFRVDQLIEGERLAQKARANFLAFELMKDELKELNDILHAFFDDIIPTKKDISRLQSKYLNDCKIYKKNNNSVYKFLLDVAKQNYNKLVKLHGLLNNYRNFLEV